MTIVQLKYFDAVCKYGSFANAANALFISQPAIAQSIRDLEREFKIRLFNRNNNKISLTEEGKWLHEHASEIISKLDICEKELHAMAENKKNIKVGIAPMVGNLYFYKIINDIQKDMPNIKLDIREAGSLEIRKWLGSNEIDLALCLLNCFEGDMNYRYKLLSAELKFFVHKDHELAKKKFLKFKDLEGQNICMLREDSFQNIYLKQRFKEENVKMQVMMYSSQLNSINTMLSYGNCGAFLFESSLKDNDDMVSLSMEPKIFLDIGIARNTQQQNFSIVDKVVEYIINKGIN